MTVNAKTSALILVDLQNDFLPGGALAVPQGDEVIAVANRLKASFGTVVATQDWHPPNHGSFAANHNGRRPGEVIELDGLQQILWPVHCVQGTPGAAFAAELDTSGETHVFPKGTHPQIDSYSGFFDNGHRQPTGLDAFLQARKIDHVVVMGLATDYCVKYTVLDAIRLGFATSLVVDGCRGVELAEGDVRRALKEMEQAGARLVDADRVLTELGDTAS